MKNLPKTQLLTLALATILPASAYAGNCQPAQVALETAIAVATGLPAANNPVIWVDMDYAGSVCEGNVAVGDIYDNRLLWLTAVAPK
jgi:hypothetical protein